MNPFLRIIKNSRSLWNLKLLHVIPFWRVDFSLFQEKERVSIELHTFIAGFYINNVWFKHLATFKNQNSRRSRDLIVLNDSCVILMEFLHCKCRHRFYAFIPMCADAEELMLGLCICNWHGSPALHTQQQDTLHHQITVAYINNLGSWC